MLSLAWIRTLVNKYRKVSDYTLWYFQFISRLLIDENVAPDPPRTNDPTANSIFRLLPQVLTAFPVAAPSPCLAPDWSFDNSSV